MEWTLCRTESPEENQQVVLTFKNSAGIHVGEATFKNNAYYYITDTEFGYYEEKYGIPIAWMIKPEPLNDETLKEHRGRIIITSNATNGCNNPSLESAKERHMSMPIFIQIDNDKPLSNWGSTSISISEAKEIVECLTSMVEFLES